MRFSNLVPFSLTQLLFLLDFTPATFTEHSCSLGKVSPTLLWLLAELYISFYPGDFQGDEMGFRGRAKPGLTHLDLVLCPACDLE